MICVTWLLLMDGIYLGGVCVLCASCMGEVLARWLYISICVKFEYASFPIGLLSFNIRNLCSVVGLCSSRFY